MPHALIGAGLIMLLAALNLPWGATSDGTLVYSQSFTIPFLSSNWPDLASQVAQNIVSSAAALSIVLVGLNYFLTGLNRLAAPYGWTGCATWILMPLMILLVLILVVVDTGALVFGIFDPLAGVAAAPWQAGFTLTGAHDELGYYVWYAGVVSNVVGALMQPFVRR